MSQYSYKILPTFEVLLDGQGNYVFDGEGVKSRYTKWLLSNSGKWLLNFSKKPSTKPKNRKFEAWYWAVYIPILADEMGYDPGTERDKNEVHAIVKSAVLSATKRVGNKVYTIVGSTKPMTDDQHNAFVERAVKWATMPGNVCEMGLIIPPPDSEYLAHELKAEMDVE